MISINNLTVAYGGFTLLNEINFHISENDKIGLVGKNGAGKSTILKLICGLQSPTNGKVAVPNDVKIGYLPQIMEHHRGRSVIDEAMTAFADMFAEEEELERVTLELAERTDYESQAYQELIIRMNEINDRLSFARSDNPQVQAERTLIGLGFKYEELLRPTAAVKDKASAFHQRKDIVLAGVILLLKRISIYTFTHKQCRIHIHSSVS